MAFWAANNSGVCGAEVGRSAGDGQPDIATSGGGVLTLFLFVQHVLHI